MSMPSQYIALVRHFFGRFFDNEFVAQNTDMQVTVTKMLALLASPGMLLPFLRYTTYLALDGYPPEARMPTLWFDRCFFFSFAMLVMGGVTVLEWDALFPDRRDYASLIPLPIRARTIFLAKVGALVLFLLGFTAAVNAVSTVLFPIISYRFTSTHTFASVGLKTLARLRWAWPMDHGGAGNFGARGERVRVSVADCDGRIAAECSEHGGFRRASVYVQCAMIFALLSLFFLFPNIAAAIPALKARNAPVLYAFPPAWFLGLNEVLLGSADPVFRALARWAEVAVSGAALVAGVAYMLAYRRHVRRTLESMEGSETRSNAGGWMAECAGGPDRAPPGGAGHRGVYREDDGPQREASHLSGGLHRRRVRVRIAGAGGDRAYGKPAFRFRWC